MIFYCGFYCAENMLNAELTDITLEEAGRTPRQKAVKSAPDRSLVFHKHWNGWSDGKQVPLIQLLAFVEQLPENPSPAPQGPPIPNWWVTVGVCGGVWQCAAVHPVRFGHSVAQGQAELNSSTVLWATPVGKDIKVPMLSSIALTLWGEKES